MFADASQLEKTPWHDYLKEVYGSSPPKERFPLQVGSWWILWDNVLANHKVSLPKSSGKCAPKNCQLSYFVENNAYSPPHTSWIWHPPPYSSGGPWTVGENNDGWVEVIHEQDPFGDEHHGCWFLYAKGSGVWYHVGKTIEFPEHGDAYKFFKSNSNEEMCQVAAVAGYDVRRWS